MHTYNTEILVLSNLFFSVMILDGCFSCMLHRRLSNSTIQSANNLQTAFNPTYIFSAGVVWIGSHCKARRSCWPGENSLYSADKKHTMRSVYSPLLHRFLSRARKSDFIFYFVSSCWKISLQHCQFSHSAVFVLGRYQVIIFLKLQKCVLKRKNLSTNAYKK